MAIDKLIPQYLNSDTDEKLVKSVEMTDNLNVRVSSDAEGTGGVIKNIKGTEVVGYKSESDAFPAGLNRVIGSVANEKNKEILFLVWNSTRNHGVYRLDMTTGKYQKIYVDSVLNFNRYSFIQCNVVVNDKNETILYWTDGINPPMKLNIQRMIKGDYPQSLFSGTDEEKLQSLTVAKQPPLKAPTYNVFNNPDITGESRIKKNNYQFAYKYIYKDGEHSSVSPYSSLSVSAAQLVDGFNTDDQQNFYNQIDVYVQNSIADVEKIIVYARRIGGKFFEIAELENSFNTNFKTVSFTDNVLGSYLSDTELNKVFDNVPQTAKAQTIALNRLMYGSYTEGYENIDTDVDIIPNYDAQPVVYDVSISLEDDISSTAGTYRNFYIDYSNLPAVVSTRSKLMINFFLDFEDIHIAGENGWQRILLDVNNKELEIIYEHKDDNTDVKRKYLSIETIRGSGVVASVLQNIWDDMSFNSETFDPAITMATEGIQIKELVDIPAGSTKAQVKSFVESILEGKYHQMFVNPTNNGRRTSLMTTGGTTPFTSESASFKGKIDMQILKYASTTNVDTYTVFAQKAELQIYEFSDDAGRTCRVISTNKFLLDKTNERFFLMNATLLNGTNGLYTDLNGHRSFKSGASHELGIVYYDDRGRSSGVQELGSVYINHMNDRASENNLDGRSSIVMRIKHSAPTWAKRWSPVYTGKGNVDLKFMYGVKGAFVPTNNIEKSTIFSSQENIYISLNSLFNKEGSYTKASSALMSYNFEEGDKLRIVKYENGQKTKHIFNIVGYVTLNEDEKENPILEKITETAKDATTGDFLVIKDNVNAIGFRYSDVLTNSSNWFKNCIVEVYRDVKEVKEDVYYEIGKTYNVTSGTHENERTETSFYATVNAQFETVTLLSTVKIFKGDILVSGSRSLTIQNVTNTASGYLAYCIDKNSNPFTSGSYLFSVSNSDSVIQLELGDVYFRIRNCVVSTDQVNNITYTNLASQNSIAAFIEDYSVSDFFRSKRSSIGRPFAYIPEARTMHRKSTITYSEPYTIDSDRMNLSSFNAGLANWLDLDITNGNVYSLINRNDALTVIQESKACQIPIGRNLIEYSDGKSGVTASKNVLGTPSYYAGDFGTSNPESVVERFGVVYYVDVKAAKIIRLSADGITPISEKGMGEFFEDKFKSLITKTDRISVIGGFDPEHDEYLVTVEPVYNSSITIGSDINNIPTDDNADLLLTGIYYTPSTILWNTFSGLWDGFCGDWEDLGNGIVFIDSLFNPLSILVDISFLGSTSTITVLITNTAQTFTAVGTLNLLTGQVTLPSTTCEGTTITTGGIPVENEGFTIGYKHKEGFWGAKYSFIPTNYVNINNELYSFQSENSGLMWKHNVNDTRNNFYGNQYNSMFEVVSNFNPSMVKVFESLGIEGDGNWSALLSNKKQQTTMSESDFKELEGHKYSMIFKDSLASTSHQIYLGKVDSVLGDTVSFTTPINSIPFLVGDVLRIGSGSTLTATGIEVQDITDRKTIKCTTPVTGINVGDNLFVQHISRIEGDPMRDIYLKIRLTSNDTDSFEVHAVSVNHSRSRLHNDRVN